MWSFLIQQVSDYKNIKRARIDACLRKKWCSVGKIKRCLWYCIVYGAAAIKFLNFFFFFCLWLEYSIQRNCTEK